MKGVWGVLAVGAVMIACLPASADERMFTYSQEAKTLPATSVELEQWVTLAARKESGTFRQWNFREELEYGFTDRLTGALYLNWEIQTIQDVPGESDLHDAKFEGASLELKYKFTDPSAHPVGTLLYAELTSEEDEVELELKAVASKALGSWTFAYNFIVEIEWTSEIDPATGRRAWEHEVLIENTAGISYSFLPALAAGLEAIIRTPYDENLDREQTAYFLGPNAHVSVGPFWGTLTFLRQVDPHGHGRLNLDEFEKYEVRLIVGWSF